MLPHLVDDRGASGGPTVVRLVTALVIGVAGLAALAAASPSLTRLISALVPLVLVVGIVVAVLRLVWTRKW